MKKFGLLFILTLGLLLSSQAQPQPSYSDVDSKMQQLPDSLSKSTNGIAKFVKLHFSNQSDQSRAIFIWISKAISYDIKMVEQKKVYHQKSEIIDEVMKTRKGICMHYAELYSAIANQVGIKTFVVAGYTKQNAKIDPISHAWCVSKIDSVWKPLDPTWGSGYVKDGTFVRKLNDEFVNTTPEYFLKSHMPFDPLWQLVYEPITNKEFYEGKLPMSSQKVKFNFKDSISHFEKQPEEFQLEASSMRIKANGIINPLIAEALQQINTQLAFIQNQKQLELFNVATKRYNQGIALLNALISYRNHQFTPEISDLAVRQMVDTVAIELSASKVELQKIKTTESKIINLSSELTKSIYQAENALNEQKIFVNKYLSTNKIFRKMLFKKYTLSGISLN
jgi:Transglutaminase-like superfamily